MDDHWLLDRLEIRGGFLESIDLVFPPGLTCIIGPRGSGKSTLAEALRCGMAGLDGASKPRLDLFKANLSRSSITIRTKPRDDGITYVIRRDGRQPAVVTTSSGKTLGVDLDRGTFLPLDGYSTSEIELIADESFGSRRRLLLDELHPREFAELVDTMTSAQRSLESNSDAVRSTRRLLADIIEQIQSLTHTRERLASLPPPAASDPQVVLLQEATRQQQLNQSEATRLASVLTSLSQLATRVNAVAEAGTAVLRNVEPSSQSKNRRLVDTAEQIASSLVATVRTQAAAMLRDIEQARTRAESVSGELAHAHQAQSTYLAELRERNQEAGRAAKDRSDAEQEVQRLELLEHQKVETEDNLNHLLAERGILRGRYLTLHNAISTLRDRAATDLVTETGKDVRISVRRSGDVLAYERRLSEGLHGAGVKGHEALIAQLTKLRPDELAQIIEQRNAEELDAVCGIGLERSQRILESFRQAIDPLVLETLVLEDVIAIELNVGPADRPLYKDASGLSRGQKCTALLPLLLARRRAPLVIDQPEDNLDNHFIFRTVVEAIQRLKARRQMVFITHNANIPVLAEADLVVVLGSDGTNGYVEKQGTLDTCKQEIIDLLEGGREAFEMRARRYGER